MLIPSGGATVAGTSQALDATASSEAGIASVAFELSGGAPKLSNQVIGTATPTIYGYILLWNTTSVPNGTYNLQSVATDTVAETAPSAPISITVDNTLQTQLLVPSSGAVVGGNVILDASAQGTAPITGVTFTATQGSTVETVGTATPTPYGWIAQWEAGASAGSPPTSSYQNGTWSIQSVATEAGGITATSSTIEITLLTLADLQNASITGAGGLLGECTYTNGDYSATYPGSMSVGTVTLTANPCTSSFTITTAVGTLSGTVENGSANPIGTDGLEAIYNLTVETGTGLFSGTTGVLFFEADDPGTGSFTGFVSLSL